jgi:hypothetical protein
MSAFSPDSYSYSDYDIKGEFNQNYRYAQDYWAPFVTDARVYNLAAAGYTWSDNERRELIKAGREPMELNIMRRPLQFYSGYLRDNLNSIVYAPVEGSDQKTADQLTKLGYYVWDKGRGFQTFLDACDEAFKPGLAWCGIHMDYTKDFINGDIGFYKRTFNSFYIDPTFESIDLSDAGFVMMRDLVDRTCVKQLLKKTTVDPKVIDDIRMSYRDDKFITYHPQFTNFSQRRDLMAYDQYYKRKSRTRKMLVDNRTSHYRDITDLPKEEMDKLKFGMGRLVSLRNDADDINIRREDVPDMDIMDVDRPFIELNIFLNGEYVYTGIDQTGITDRYPGAPILCYFEPSIWRPAQRVQGIGSSLYSVQRQFIKRHMKIVDMMDSSISTGYKYLLGTVPDPTEMQQAGQNKMIGVDPENNPAGLAAVEQLRGGEANAALIEYQQVLDNLTLTLANINESIIGISDKGNTQVSGKLEEYRIAQGLRGNRKVFDNVEYSQQILGELVLSAIQLNMPPGKVERILAEKPTEQFYDESFEQYDAVIKQGLRSQSQKSAYYSELVMLKRDGIVDIPQAAIVKALQMAGLSDLEKEFEQQDKANAEAQKKIQQHEELKLELMNADKEQKLSLSQERRTRVITDVARAQREIAEAEEKRAQAALDKAKTITEIAQMGDERIMRVLEFVHQMEREEKLRTEEGLNQAYNQSEVVNQKTQGTAENLQAQAMQQLQSQIQNPQGGSNGELQGQDGG